MNVILESEPGAELICVTEFPCLARGTTRSWETMRTFRVGDRVRYVGYYRTRTSKTISLLDGPLRRGGRSAVFGDPVVLFDSRVLG